MALVQLVSATGIGRLPSVLWADATRLEEAPMRWLRRYLDDR